MIEQSLRERAFEQAHSQRGAAGTRCRSVERIRFRSLPAEAQARREASGDRITLSSNEDPAKEFCIDGGPYDRCRAVY